MATILVKEQMGTKYIINALVTGFKVLLENAAKNGDTVDLADCKLGPLAASAINSYIKSVKIINSASPYLNGILNEIVEAATSNQSFKSGEYYVIPSDVDGSNFTDYIRDIPKGSYIKPVLGLNADGSPREEVPSGRYMAFIIMLIAMKPEVTVDISSFYMAVYDYVAPMWKVAAKEHNKYILFGYGGTKVVNVENGYIEVSDGKLKAEVYVNREKVLPYDFGTEILVETDERGALVGEWAGVIDKAWNALVSVPMQKKTLVDYLKLRT